MLDDQERAFLKTIHDNPFWRSILKKMEEFSRTPRYQRGKEQSNQVSDWIYQSGRLDERESILSLLSLSSVKVNLEK